jgi:hypothetical protein
MWKKLVLLGGVLACLGLPAFAAEAIAPDVLVKKTIPVELKGKLQRRVGMRDDPHLPHLMNLPVPGAAKERATLAVDVWEIVVDGNAYELDFDNKHDLWVLAEKSVGQTVLVNGTWDGNFVHVASLKADVEHVKKTVKVEVKGRLIAFYTIPESLIVPVQARVPREFPPYDLGPMWQVIVGDKAYTLDFEGAEGLLPRARELDGRAVILTGELENETTIRVASLKADDEYYKVTETHAEVKGKLRYVITMWDTGEVVKVCDELPEWICKCWVVNYGFEIDGKTYVLDLHGDKNLEDAAKSYLGLTVTAAGALNGDRVKVDSLEWDDIRFWIEQGPCELAK